jgi:hypothetical protein
MEEHGGHGTEALCISILGEDHFPCPIVDPFGIISAREIPLKLLKPVLTILLGDVASSPANSGGDCGWVAAEQGLSFLAADPFGEL